MLCHVICPQNLPSGFIYTTSKNITMPSLSLKDGMVIFFDVIVLKSTTNFKLFGQIRSLGRWFFTISDMARPGKSHPTDLSLQNAFGGFTWGGAANVPRRG